MRWRVTDDWKPYRPPELAPVALASEPVAGATPGPVADRSEADLWAAWRERSDGQARHALVERFRGFAKGIAATLYGRGSHHEIAFEEFLQFAVVGLLEAVDRYDPSRGAKFKTFAAPRIRGAIVNGLARLTEHQQQAATRRRLEAERVSSLIPERGLGDGDALLAQLGDIGVNVAIGFVLEAIGLDEGSRDTREADPYAQVELRQARQQVKAFVDRLPARERAVIDEHYLGGKRFDRIAEEMGVTPARVSQLHRQALERLRALICKASGCDVVY